MRTVVALLALLAAAAPAAAAILTVAPDGAGEYSTIQAAVDAAAYAGDVIELLPGAYRGPGNRDVATGGKTLVLRSAGGDPLAVEILPEGSSLDPHRFLSVAGSSEFVLEGVTVQGGFAGADRIPAGGALTIGGGARARIVNCRFLANRAEMSWDNAGGAAYVDQGSEAIFEGCLFAGNSGYFGGAVGVNHYSRASFVDCAFLDNTAGRGGAIWGNSTDKVACLLAGNTAEQGGAIWGNGYNVESSTRCTYVGNGAAEGGAIYAQPGYGSPVRLENTIIAFGTDGGAILAVGGVTVEISCSDLYGNIGGDWTGPLAPLVETAGNFSADPCFCAAAAGEYTLCADSFCLPGGHPWGCADLVGRDGAGCADCGCTDVVGVRDETWSAVRERYRTIDR